MGKPGVLQSMGLQRVGHTEWLNNDNLPLHKYITLKKNPISSTVAGCLRTWTHSWSGIECLGHRVCNLFAFNGSFQSVFQCNWTNSCSHKQCRKISVTSLPQALGTSDVYISAILMSMEYYLLVIFKLYFPVYQWGQYFSI